MSGMTAEDMAEVRAAVERAERASVRWWEAQNDSKMSNTMFFEAEREYGNAQSALARYPAALLAHIEAQAAELAALRTIAQGVVNRDWHRGDYEEGGTCDWCGYSQEPHWKNEPPRHAHDCLYVAAKAAVEGQPYAERRRERDRSHG